MRFAFVLVLALAGCSVISDAKDQCSDPLCDGDQIIECSSVRHSGKRMLAHLCDEGMTCSNASGKAECVAKAP